MQMTPEELANIELEKLKQTGYELSFPIDPIKILKDAGVIVVLKDFEKFTKEMDMLLNQLNK